MSDIDSPPSLGNIHLFKSAEHRSKVLFVEYRNQTSLTDMPKQSTNETSF